jgi:branched-subunit amino acid aminotransferase/4-amino-4-deoxychorismate lyase
MNMFFVYDDVVVTAPLTGSILKGVTRDSSHEACRYHGLPH